MKILKSAPFLLFSAVFAAGLSLPAAADDTGEVKIISRQIERNLERVTPRSQGTRAVFNNNFQPRTKAKSNRKFNEGPIFGDNDCTRRTCGGAMFGPQTCKRIKLPCEDCGDQPKPVKPRPHIKNYITLEEDIFQTIHHRCGDFAPLQLEWVDFRIKKGRDRTYSRRLGNYRFRIFGCRRDQRHAVLNEGRIIQKDMEFIRIFEDKVSDCYNIVKIPNDVCLSGVNKPLPEYVLTAEITDYFMNLCDEYDWKDAEKANLRTGSAQMTVTWRLMDLSKSNVLWKGESNGYSEVPDGEYNAEMILIERAFADAVDNLRQLPGFEDQLAVRQTPEDLEAQKQALIAMERMNDPVKCQYQPEIKQAQTLCPLQENGGTAADGQMCTAQTEPELLSICPADNPDCSGSIEELGGSAGNGQYAQDNQTLILDQPAQDYSDTEVAVAEVTPVEESGDTIDMGGSLNAREAEIADAAAKAENRTVQFDEFGNAIELSGGAEDSGTPPDFCPLDADGNPQCGEQITVEEGNYEEEYACEDGNFCEPSMFEFLHEEDRSCSPSPVPFLHKENRGCEPSIFDDLFGTKPSCALEEEQEIMVEDFIEQPYCQPESDLYIEESGGFEESGNFVEEDGGVIDFGGAVETDGQSWTALDIPPEETQDMIERNQLCVVNRGPYDKLTPENIYKVRASVVGVTNANGMKGAGLLISDQFVLTSADLIVKDNNRYRLKTINGVELSGRAVRINIKKNTALILLDEKTQFTPLSLNLELPEIGTGGYMALGLLEDSEGGEGYLDNNGKVSGYRYSDEKGAEIIVDTFVQTVTVGGALIDEHGTINGMSHAGKKFEDGPDLFIPITTAINSVGLEICGQENKAPKVPMAVIKPVSTAIDGFTGSKEPKPMDKKGRK
ncbi:MAG TPA: hypothetical protein IAD20_02625 [Candidatus Scatocola faecipullorum]|uniref:Serine protease n=1 Tax=Candidatus Scatocola faecipullorum TaxID=2840917 RepID=A0A9D1SAI5_9PROT|nr:hypothetical protein [Candidatus Scatocola faecipullorum]